MSFEQILASVKQMKANREILNYTVEKSYDWGRYITVETEQGWCPHPVWQEFEDIYYPDL